MEKDFQSMVSSVAGYLELLMGALVAAEAVFDNSITKMTTLHYKVAVGKHLTTKLFALIIKN